MVVRRIAFRTDASNQIGTGHFMRCLTLADSLKQRGAHIRFVSCKLPTYLCDMLKAKGIELAQLDCNVGALPPDELMHANWLETSQVQDAQAAILALSDQSWDWVVVDHYALDARWEGFLRKSTKQIMVIDDIADRQHDCDVLLDQNLCADMHTRYIGKVPAHCQLLLGPRFALLRDEFRRLREQVKPRTREVKRILVFFGGVDLDNYTGLAVDALVEAAVKRLHVDVVIGTQHPFREQIEMTCALYGFICHVQTSRMAELMAAADLAIGAGGSASWERCCMGLPCIVGAVAQNQVQAAKELSVIGAVKYVGTKHEITKEKLKQFIEGCSLGWLNNASLLGLALVDSEGALRVINILEESITGNKVLEHWNQRATLGECAGSNDLIAKELEI
jgi:UDP-2,4-diacetamido-2,4,6-trideoxy-beta-L-altropyranose hydrolase